jgi:hypothetical protein
MGINHPGFLLKDKYKVEKGVYDLTEMFTGTSAVPAARKPIMEVATSTPTPVATPESKVVSMAKLAMEIDGLVPAKDDTYVAFGFHRDA